HFCLKAKICRIHSQNRFNIVAGQKFGFSAATFSSSATVELKFKVSLSSLLIHFSFHLTRILT
ncbi:unnamed protein product, partial [Arabidopsis thaliana]